MALETGTYINSLNAANPVATDGLSQADDHMRLIKSTIKATFPNLTGAVNATHTEINTAADGSTSATSTTLVDADRVVVNDDGTMVQVAMTDVQTYIDANMTLRADVVTASSVADDAVGTDAISDGAVTAAKLATGAAFQSGMVMPYAGSSAPTGWLFAYGQAVSRTTYADLYTALGTTYGAGDGSTTFNLPDMRGRTVAGQDDMGGSSANRLTSPINGDTLGATGGSESHTLTEAQLPSHDHHMFANTAVNLDGNHNLSATEQVAAENNSYGSGDEKYALGKTTTAASVGLSGTAGSGSSHPNIQPTIILNYIIKT